MSIRREVRDGVFFRSSGPTHPLGTFLYVHGLGESGLCFEPLLTHKDLAGWRQIVADLPGYGKSDWAPSPLRLLELAEFVWRNSTQDARSPTVLVGHSMGGVICQHICESNSQHFRAFVNVEGNISPDDCTYSSQAAHFKSSQFRSTGFQALADRVYEGGRTDPPQRSYYASLRFCDSRAFHLNSDELVKVSAQEDLATRLAALPLPTLYIAGLRHRGESRTVELLEQAGVRWEGWDDSGHWPFLDETDRFVGTLKEFVAGL